MTRKSTLLPFALGTLLVTVVITAFAGKTTITDVTTVVRDFGPDGTEFLIRSNNSSGQNTYTGGGPSGAIPTRTAGNLRVI